MEDQTTQPTNLIQKLAEACDAVGGVEKKGHNDAQRYKYVKAADIAKAIRHELFGRGIVILQHEHEPEYLEVELTPDRDNKPRKAFEVRIQIEFRVTAGTTSISLDAYGTARDSGDKAIWKAKTGALKYFLRGLGLIPDEKDDPEHDAPGDEEAGELHSATKQDNTVTLAGVITAEKQSEKGIWYTIHTLTAEGEADAYVLSPNDSGRLAEKIDWLVNLRVRPLVVSKPGLFFTLVDVLTVRKPENPDSEPATQNERKSGITTRQINRLYAIKSSKGISDTWLTDALGREGFEHTNDLTPLAYKRICDEMELMA